MPLIKTLEQMLIRHLFSSSPLCSSLAHILVMVTWFSILQVVCHSFPSLVQRSEGLNLYFNSGNEPNHGSIWSRPRPPIWSDQGSAVCQTMDWGRFLTYCFGSDQAEKSESRDQTRQVWKCDQIWTAVVHIYFICIEEHLYSFCLLSFCKKKSLSLIWLMHTTHHCPVGCISTTENIALKILSLHLSKRANCKLWLTCGWED